MAEDPVDRGGEGDKKTIPSSSVKKGGANTSVALSNNKLYDQESNVVKRQVSKLVARFRKGSITRKFFTWNLDLLRRKIRAAIIQTCLNIRREIVVDAFCGTATSCALYHLKNRPNSYVIGIDRDKSLKYVLNFIPQKYHDRFLFIKADVSELTWSDIQSQIQQKWSWANLSMLSHLHLSPSCVSMSRAERFSIHRHADGLSPKSATAIADDAVIEHCVSLIQQFRKHAPLALITIENPVNDVFGHLPGIRKLLKSSDWRMLAASYCQEADEFMDPGYWPRKDTNVLTCGLPRWFHGKLCDNNCKHMVPGTCRHRVQLCSGKNNLPSQYVVRDPMVKGMIPHGLLHGIFMAHLEWRQSKERPVMEKEVQKQSRQWDADVRAETEQSVLKRSRPVGAAYVMCAHSLELTASFLNTVPTEVECHFDEAEDFPEDFDELADDELLESQDNDEDPDPRVIDPRERLEEHLVDDSGLLRDEEVSEIRPLGLEGEISLCPETDTVAAWARFIPGLDKEGPIWDVQQLLPAEILCADEITFDNAKISGKKQHMLFVYDVRTGGIRVEEERFKTEHGDKFRKMAINEGWNKRPYKTTVISDGCGSMVHLKNAAIQLGIGTWDIPPYSPECNPAEQAISRFKSTVMAVLLGACVKDGPIDSSFVNEAAKYVTWVHERFGRTHQGIGEAYVSPFELNLGRKPRLEGLVAFGTPGYAFVPPEVRKSRKWGKSVRSEPVLMLGYQNMYSRVYRCLTERGTIIHSQRVQWNVKGQLGVFLAGRQYPKQEAAVKILEFPAPLFAESKSDHSDQTAARAVAQSSLPCEPRFLILRRNHTKQSRATHISTRVSLLDGTCLVDAIGRYFEDNKGNLVKYLWKDFNYDMATGWLLLEQHDKDVSEAGTHSAFVAHARSLCTLASVKDPKLEQLTEAMAFFAMRDLKWKPYLRGEHRKEVIHAHDVELNALTSTKVTDADGVQHPVLEELFNGSAEYTIATGKNHDGSPRATNCRELLEFKRSGVWKARVVVQGFRESKELLDGPDFIYSSNVVGLSSVRRILLTKCPSRHAIAQVDISTAFLQSDMFPPGSPARYLRLFDPVAGKVRFFRQWGVLYGSCSAPRRWQETLHPWIETQDFVAGKNEQCIFYNSKTKVLVATYTDDIIARGPAEAVVSFMTTLAKRFHCKPPRYFTEATPLDHLGMMFFMNERGVFLSMEHYIATMIHNLKLDTSTFRKCRTPISAPIDDYTSLSEDESAFFMSGTGMIGWLAVTGRPDLKYAHSRISQHLASPNVGALKALMHAIRYSHFTRDFCLHQSHDDSANWSMSCDSDQSGNTEVQNRRRSQMGYLAIFGSAPIVWGSKASTVQFDDWTELSSTAQVKLDLTSGGVPVCHPEMDDLHPDMSSAAAEVYAASIALAEFLHLSYINDEMGYGTIPIVIGVDNSTAIAFSENSTKRSKMRHIDCRQLWVQALRNRKLCKLIKVGTEENLSDMFTKILGPIRFEQLRDQMMVREPLPTASAAA